jgi:glycosyltransferase involved in cell wall biosynthesis
MRVALNLVYLVPGETGGMETYARELIPRLARHVDLVALVNREAAAEDFGCDQRVVPVHARSRVQWVRGEQQHVPRLAREAGADLIHSLASTAPLRSAMPRITTIHDLNYKLVPEAHSRVLALGMGVLVPAAARRSHRIITDAESTRRDLREHLGVAEAKVDVVPLGVNPVPPVAPTPPDVLRERLGIAPARQVLLSVSGKKPSKNLLRLIDAVAGMASRPVLVVPGYATPHEAELRARAADRGVDAVWPPWLGAADLEGLYALADGFAFPSLYEGFGLPVLEAMARGVPVATSDRGSLAEVAGDAALTFDPTDVEAMRAAIERLPAERERLAAAGRERARSFTWERTAELTAEAYRRVPGRAP